MEVNKKLSFAIPTYNRAKFLDNCLKLLVPLAKKYNIQIFISDNASNDNTKEIVQKWINIYPLIFYQRNEKNIGADRNIEIALKMSDTEYTWLLGDSSLIDEEGLDYIYELISNNKKYDALIVNQSDGLFVNQSDGAKRVPSDGVKNIPEKDYSDRNQLLSDLGWHMTLLSTYIFSKSIINFGNFKRYYNSYFVHMGILFEYIADKDFIVHWIDKPIIYRIKKMDGENKKSYTGLSGFEIWTKVWSNLVFSLPVSYNLETKLKCIKDLSEKTGILQFTILLDERSLNNLNYKIYKQYSQFFPFTIKYSKLVILFISILPIKLALIMNFLILKIYMKD